MLPAGLDACLERAAGALLRQRNAGGYWEGRLASLPLATAAALSALAGNELPAPRRESALAYLSKTQNPDGGWGDTALSKSNLAATLLVLCADAAQRQPPSATFISNEALRKAQAYVEKLGGVHAGLRRVYGSDLTFQTPIRMAAASAGLLDWKHVEALPFELALAPRGLLGALRLPVVSYALPALVSVGLSRHHQAPSWMLPLCWLREALTERALKLILKMQPSSGGYLEAVPITAFCLIGLKAAERAEHPVARGALRFLLDSQREDGSWPVEVNLSIWNTTRAIDALAAGGMLETALSATERAATRDWLLARQVRAVSPYTETQPGGWGWNHLSGSVPDADDTAGALLSLRHLGVAADHPAIVDGRRWLLALQNRNGGWPTFCRGWEKLPFDRSAPDLTAHALRALSVCDSDFESAPQKNGWAYLRRVQAADGSFAPLWFGCESAPDASNRTYGTAHVLFGGRNNSRASEIMPRASAWLRGIQNSDGSFGGCAGAPGSAEETGLALRALAEHGTAGDSAACASGVRWLLERQRGDGAWDSAPIGFYFAVLWYYEELYPLYYALGGLGAFRATSNAPQNSALKESLSAVCN